MMRVIVVGTEAQRERLRDALSGTSLLVVGEASTTAEARLPATTADALLVATAPETLTEDSYVEELTPREVDALDLLAQGFSNKAIAARLGISDQTVKFHLSAISAKLGATNRTDAVRLAIKRGLVTL